MIPKRISLTASALGAGAFLWYASSPGWELFDGLPLLLVGTICGLMAFFATAVALSRWRQSPAPAKAATIAFAALLACLPLMRTSVPLAVRILLSEPWLRPKARALILNQGREAGDFHCVGLFSVRAGGVGAMAVFDTGPDGLFGNAGFAFISSGLPPQDGGTYSHLYGPWWRYEYHDD